MVHGYTGTSVLMDIWILVSMEALATTWKKLNKSVLLVATLESIASSPISTIRLVSSLAT